MAYANQQNSLQYENRQQIEEIKQEILQSHQTNQREYIELSKKFQDNAEGNQIQTMAARTGSMNDDGTVSYDLTGTNMQS